MTNNRNKYKLFEIILRICKEPQLKTEIVYKTNINFTLAKNYLEILIKNEYLSIHEKDYIITKRGILQKYTTTEKGLLLLQKLIELNEMIK